MLKPRATGQIQTPGTALCPQFIILRSNFSLLRPSLPSPGPAHDATRESKFPPGIPLSMALDTENDLLVPVPRDIAKLFLQ